MEKNQNMFVRIPLISSVYWICLGFKRVFTGIKHTCEIDLTERCNLECSHCYFYADGKDKITEDVSLDIWAERFTELYAKGIRKIIEEIERVKKKYPLQLLFTNFMVNWYKHPNHTKKCYWRENVDHYDVDFNHRACFVNNPDCGICGCYAGAFSSIADKPFEIIIYSIKLIINRITRLFRKKC